MTKGVSHLQSEQKVALDLNCLDRTEFLTAIAFDTRFWLNSRLFVGNFYGRYGTVSHALSASDTFFLVDNRSRLKEFLQLSAEKMRKLH